MILYLLPDVVLFFVLFRMVQMNLWRERPGIFWFLVAWFGYSLFTLLASAAHATNTTAYARAFFWSSMAVLALAAFPLARAAFVFWQPRGWRFALVLLAVAIVAATFVRAVTWKFSLTPGVAALVITCFLTAVAGAAFFLASFGVRRLDAAFGPDVILWRGMGAYFLAFGFGLLAAARWGKSAAANDVVVFLCTAIWLVLFLYLAPRPEPLFNLEKLGIVWPLVSRQIVAVSRWRLHV